MASLVDSSSWSLVAAKPTSFKLKDFLLQDDFSSCSSNGFRSFPRSQCCTTTVRFLLHNDFKRTDSSVTKTLPPPTASTRIALPAVSTLQKASNAVVRAFKQFPLPRSISRKLILVSFWKKSNVTHSNTKRWKSFREFLDEKEPPSSSDHDHADSTAIAIAGRNSICSCSNNSISWTESEFTSEMIPSSSSGNFDSCSEIDVAKDDKDSPGNLIPKTDGIALGKDSIEETTAAYPEKAIKQLGNEEEKEQSSPVSVLDFGLKRLEKGAELEPVDLKKRFADIGNGPRELGLIISTKEGQREQKAFELLKLVKSSQCFTLKTENLVLDLIHEKLEEDESSGRSGHKRRGCGFEEEKVVKLIEGWMNGEGGEMRVMGWEVVEGRSLYIKDMEKAGKWRSLGGEKEELAAEVETEVWISLLHELY
ncbi:uncharacterized protein LOC111491600 [Cucurbita maxima]|uniref:Uncharacterized protein LOC111491600 n=1 Tax=Cucurbita maxima TaxID=3661 RepID=A0A6J1K8F7_CUCMA|nr:uncharacterized protein LOC111491600 [Cucurbita maxima]